MGKYYSNSNDGVVFQDSGLCSEAAASKGAVAYDDPTHDPAHIPLEAQMCWKIKGKAVIIGDTTMSVQAGFEMINFNFHIDGTQPAFPVVYAFPHSGL